MGYTHYFEQQRDLNNCEWVKLKEQFIQLVKNNEDAVILKDCYISDDIIKFNGIDDLEHETMILTKEGVGWSFCKTARKPYDRVVSGLLILVSVTAPNAFRISSDGDIGDEEWVYGTVEAGKIIKGIEVGFVGDNLSVEIR